MAASCMAAWVHNAHRAPHNGVGTTVVLKHERGLARMLPAATLVLACWWHTWRPDVGAECRGQEGDCGIF